MVLHSENFLHILMMIQGALRSWVRNGFATYMYVAEYQLQCVNGGVTHGNRNVPISVIHVSTLIFVCQTWKPYSLYAQTVPAFTLQGAPHTENLFLPFLLCHSRLIRLFWSLPWRSHLHCFCGSLPGCFLHLFPSVWHVMGWVNSCEPGCPE